jgi:hypothetical protein
MERPAFIGAYFGRFSTKQNLEINHIMRCVVENINSLHKEDMQGIKKATYLPIDSNKYMSQLAILNIVMKICHNFKKTFTDSRVPQDHDMTSKNPKKKLDFYSFEQVVNGCSGANCDTFPFWTRVRAANYLNATAEDIKQASELTDDKLKEIANDAIESLEGLIEKAGRIREIEGCAEYLDKKAAEFIGSNYNPVSLGHGDVLKGFSDESLMVRGLKNARDYLKGLAGDNFSRQKLLLTARCYNMDGRDILNDASIFLDEFEKMLKSKKKKWDRKSLAKKYAESFHRQMNLAGMDVNLDSVIKAIKSDQYDPWMYMMHSLKYASMKFYDSWGNKAGSKDILVIDPHPVEHSNTAVLLPARGIEADFTKTSELLNAVDYVSSHHPDDTKIVALLGQTLGNFEEKDRRGFIQGLYDNMQDGDYFLIGVDLRPSKKDWDERAIEQRVANMEREYAICGDFFTMQPGIPENARFVPKYSHENSRMEFRLEWLEGGKHVVKDMGFSHKFAKGEIRSLLKDAGFKIVGQEYHTAKRGTYTDGHGRGMNSGPEYAVLLARKGK